MISEVGAPVEMGARLGFDSRQVEKLPMFGGSECEGFLKQRPQRPAEPVVRGNIEPDFLPRKYGRAEFGAHQVSKHDFLTRAPDFKAGRERVCELHDPMIEKGRPHFDCMSHAGAVHFSEDVIGKKIFLIEREQSLQIATRAGQSFENRIERRRHLRLWHFL